MYASTFRDELWIRLWEQCCNEKPFIEALGDAAARGDLSTTDLSPSPDSTQVISKIIIS